MLGGTSALGLQICFVGCNLSVNNKQKGKFMIAAMRSSQILGLVGGFLGTLIGLFGAAVGIAGAAVGVYYGFKNQKQSQIVSDGFNRAA